MTKQDKHLSAIAIKLIDGVEKLTKEAFNQCTDEEKGAYIGSQKAIIHCICLKLQSDKWAKKTLGYWYP